MKWFFFAPEFMTIFVNWQWRVTLDSIRNSCDFWNFKGTKELATTFLITWALCNTLLVPSLRYCALTWPKRSSDTYFLILTTHQTSGEEGGGLVWLLLFSNSFKIKMEQKCVTFTFTFNSLLITLPEKKKKRKVIGRAPSQISVVKTIN